MLKEMILSLVGAGVMSVLVNYGLAYAAKLAAKTKNHVDDKIVALIRGHAPEIVKVAEDLVKKELGAPTTTARPLSIDHRNP